MGQRHNRKRTRSRPRHRESTKSIPHQRSFSLHSAPSFQYLSSPPLLPTYAAPLSTATPASHWDQQYSAWQDRLRHQHQQQRTEEALEAERLRMFGGEAGDEVSLCEPMLRVVMDLFNGIDYEDP